MTPPNTERRHPRSTGLGALDANAVLSLMDDEEPVVTRAVARARPALAAAAVEMARTCASGGTVAFVGGGTSGHLVLQEVAELGPTFGAPPGRFRAHIASSSLHDPAVVTAREDDGEAGPAAVADLGPGDLLIAVAASGSTPFVLATVRNAHGIRTCGIANNPDAPLLAEVDFPILLDTGPELLTGSTRLKAGTAQKLALNRITTAAHVLLGAVRENHMVELRGTNDKLRRRAVAIVTDLMGVDEDRAREALDAAGWHVRSAVEHLAAP
ncbi:N-acetylmuramic acid 6-phosphate etherase [Saccharothrix carnea]|uniref:N-acetylmuramic acid 6-phosphate etherase n=1 Tax=Saccharothrix carnea TaxID=1280637 RepID=A0A2P8I1G3_SACCR|nr:N-acetylmuramic acid 6-phosphate etherase [Saccharothrix carnea]PSL52306.1 N-acetylmuramic acid 6-phosphate etherase [Saccharothrix carnea]